MKLFQIFNVYNLFTPTKLSAYIKVIGVTNIVNYFDIDRYDVNLDIYGVTIDSLNFQSITQNTNKIMAFDSFPDYTGNGYLESISPISSSDYSIVEYPVRSTDAASLPQTYKIWARINTPSSDFTARVYLDSVLVTTISGAGLANDWEWIESTFTISDTNIKTLGIKIETVNGKIDKMYIAPYGSAVTPVGTGLPFSISPYITLHSEVYTVGDDEKPISPLYIYDYKNSLEDLRFSDWYNFDINFLDNSWAVEWNDRYSLVLFTSGCDLNKYLIWDLYYSDEYDCGPSGILNK